MLHNSGPYGPNDAPINMGTAVNMTQISNPMNMANNLNNLGKLPQQAPQSASTHYNMPDYMPFGHTPLNLGPPMSSYPNYPPFGFQQSYISQPSNVMQDSNLNNVQNGMLPMNLNVHNDHGSNVMNYNCFDARRPEISNSEYKDSYSRRMPINIPQVHTKAFQKHIGMEDNFGQFNSTHDQTISSNITKVQDKPTIDNNRRRSLENTVKLIENILINSSKDKRSTKDDIDPLLPPEINRSNIQNEIPCEPLRPSLLEKLLARPDPDKQETINETKTTETQNTDENLESDSLQESEETLPIDHDELKGIEVKVEPITTWTDTENLQPFQRDINGMQREDLDANSVVTDGDNNINEAKEAATNGLSSNTVYECHHCGLFFKHPKRFLVHTKWHSFGLTNEKREEVAREKEFRKEMKKEARIMEKLSSKEVKDGNVEGKIFPCKDCDKIFSAKSGLKTHRQRSHPTSLRECRICHKPGLGWLALRQHLATHTSDSGYQCADCPKRFKYAHSLAKHRGTHMEKTHGCDQCEKKFGSQALLRMHMKCHERVARGATYRCTYCGKGFFESYNLQVHERTHRNERPFLCEICNTSFGTNSSLKRHLKVSHNTSKPFVCETCHRCFVSEKILDRHCKRVHSKPEDFKFLCKQCPGRYMKLTDLQKHVYKMHPKGKKRKKSEDE